VHSRGNHARWPLANGRFLSCAALALAGLFIGQQGDAHRDRTGRFEWLLAQALGVWALLWWTVGAGAEIDQFVGRAWQTAAAVAAVGASGLVLESVSAARGWAFGRRLALGALPLLALLVCTGLDDQPHLLAHAGWLAWPFALGSVYFVLARLERGGPTWIGVAYAPAFWLLTLVVGLALGGLFDSALGLTQDWALGAAGAGGAGVLLAALLGRHVEAHLTLGMAPIAALAVLWWGVLNVEGRGNAAPLPHVPLLNPVDASLGLLAVALLGWWGALRRHVAARVTEARRRFVILVASASAFVWLNGILARAVHQWTGVRFRIGPLWSSVALQSSLSIAWTSVALVGMLVSTRRGWRSAWMAFAALLGVVVVKLFVVDLSQLSTVAKIGTFLVVGVLLLVVGYLSPVPPAQQSDAAGGLDAESEGGI